MYLIFLTLKMVTGNFHLAKGIRGVGSKGVSGSAQVTKMEVEIDGF